jgi:nickel transport protein
MNKPMNSFFVPSLFVFIVLAAPLDSGAHGTAYRIVKDANLAAVEFHYSDGEPMAYAEVLVFGPQDRQVEHQNGRTDRHGKFAFCPDMPGAWRITANDGMGHLCEATVDVGPGSLAGKADTPQGDTDVGPPVQVSKGLKIIAGLSLIFNLAFAAQFFHQRSKTSKRRS